MAFKNSGRVLKILQMCKISANSDTERSFNPHENRLLENISSETCPVSNTEVESGNSLEGSGDFSNSINFQNPDNLSNGHSDGLQNQLMLNTDLENGILTDISNHTVQNDYIVCEIDPLIKKNVEIVKNVTISFIENDTTWPNASFFTSENQTSPAKDQVGKQNEIKTPTQDLCSLLPSSTSCADFSSGSSTSWEPSSPDDDQSTSHSDGQKEAKENNSDSDENIPLGQLSNKRKKGQGPMQRKLRLSRSESKRKGEEYITAKGKNMPAKKHIPLPKNCRAKCFKQTENINLNQIYNDYRNLTSRDTQKRYLASLITIKPKERTRLRKTSKNRQVTVLYKLEGIEGNICKKCFLKIFGEGRGFLDEIIKKKKNAPNSIILKSDLRGVGPPGNKRSEADITFAKDFINSFPAYESHYSRRHTKKRYLGYDLNLQLLYRLYKEKIDENKEPNNKPLSLSVFRNVFKSLGLNFKKPSNDTCKTCDALDLKIKCAPEEKKEQLQNQRTEHQDKASFNYDCKRTDKKKAEESQGKIIVATFDLQKCLPTPNLSASVSFYKRKLWTFNLTVRNTTTKSVSCYIWYETVAQRGADEIASCLFKFIMSLPDEVEEIIFYSDTCPGQNRNNILPVMFLTAINQKQNLKIINHKFLVPGHTHLECDSDHAAIERFVKERNSTISIPQDWASVIKMASKRFDVVMMQQTDFFSFSKLFQSVLVKRNISKDKLSFAWNKIFWLQYTKDESDVGFKYTLHGEEPFRFYSMLKRGKTTLDNIEIPEAYTQPLPLEYCKYKDILDLLPFIDPVYHNFYKTLNPDKKKSQVELVSDSEEDETDIDE